MFKQSIGCTVLRRAAVTAGVIAAVGLGLGNGCGGLVGAAQAASGAVTVRLSNASARNAAACKAKELGHVWVTVADVKAHQSHKGKAGWQDLTPDLAAAPVQIDLMADTAGNESTETPFPADCTLTTLDENTSGLPAGKYQQLRLILVPNGSTPAPSTNACAASLGDTVYNCVQLTDGSFHALATPSATKSGIKIPSTQIMRGGLLVQPDKGLDLDIDLNACRSVVARGVHGHHGHGKGKGLTNAVYSLKPVIHAGEITLNALISGDVMAATSSDGNVTVGSTPVASANVWLEEVPGTDYTVGTPSPGSLTESVYDVVATAQTDADGHFALCPVPAGTYEIVVDAATSDATITTGVNVDSSGGPTNLVIPLVPASTTAVTLNGQFTTANTTATGDVITYGATQEDGVVANQAQIPFLDGSAPLSQSVTTSGTFDSTNCPATVTSCPTGTNCVCFALTVPPDNPVIGPAGGTYASSTSSTATYSIFGDASQIGSLSTSECAPSNLITQAGPAPIPAPTLSFAGCD